VTRATPDSTARIRHSCLRHLRAVAALIRRMTSLRVSTLVYRSGTPTSLLLNLVEGKLRSVLDQSAE